MVQELLVELSELLSSPFGPVRRRSEYSGYYPSMANIIEK